MKSTLPSKEKVSYPSNVATLLEQVAAEGKSLLEGSDLAREALLAKARSLCNVLETPMEAILRTGWANVSSTLRKNC